MNESREWKRILQSLSLQWEYLNELDPSQPMAAFGAMQAQFDAVMAEFRARPTLDGAIALDEIGQWLIRKAREVYVRPDPKLQDFRQRTMAALEEVRARARAEAQK